MRREGVARGFELLARKQRAFALTPRDDQIAHDHVVFFAPAAQCMAGVVCYDLGARVLDHGLIGLSKIHSRCVDHLGNELDDRDFFNGMQKRAPRGDSGAETEKGDAMRRRMQEQRDMSLHALVSG